MLAFQTINDPPTTLDQVRPETPKALEAICLKCLEKDPARRFSTAAELADALDRWLRGEVVFVNRASFWQRIKRLLVPGTPPIKGEGGAFGA